MRRFFTRKRLSLASSGLGVALMGVDLMVTRSLFSHIGELMLASLLCLVAGIALDRPARSENPENP